MLMPCHVLLQGEDHRCLDHLAEYLRDEYKNKRGQQVGRAGVLWLCCAV